jgi:capsular exopolysaccharide synthesis family protein
LNESEILLTASEPGTPSPSSTIDVREYLRLVVSRWPLILLVTALTVALALVHYFVTPPQYRAETLLQIEQRSPLALSDDSNPYLDAWLTQKYYPTQYRLLRSRGFAERVVQRLNLAPQLGLDSSGLDQNPEQVADEAVLANLARRLLGRIRVDPIQGTELVTLTYTSSQPEQAAEIVNAFAQEYISWNIESRSVIIDKTSRFLEAELEEIKAGLQRKEAQLEEYSRRTDIVTLDPASNPTLQRLANLNGEVLKSQAELRGKEARLRELSQLARDSVANEESKGLISEMRKERLRKEADYEAKLQVYKPDWPAMVELRAAIEDGKRAYERAVDEYYEEAENRYRAEAQAARNQVRRLKSEIAKVKSEAIDLGSVSVEYNNLQMELAELHTRQDDLLGQLSKTTMSARMFGNSESNVRVVEHALVPSRSFRPSLRLDLTAGLASGLALGIGLVLLLHFLDRTVKTPEELEKILQLPLLGVIPDVSEKSKSYGLSGYYGYRKRSRPTPSDPIRQIELLPALHPRQAVSEAYRSLRTALLLSSAEELKLISITSADSGEGKTATAANLGTVLAQLGKRVLLVDGDLRKPRMFKVFQVSNRAGLVNFLTGNVPPEDLVLPTGVDNLFLCPAGPHPPNPSELLASDRMKEYLLFAQASYDFVIVDTPPVLAVTDAVLVAAMCHGVVLCFRSNKVLREDVQTCRNRLLRSEVRILGAVLNRYAPSRSGGYGGKYYYYESYGEDEKSSSAA